MKLIRISFKCMPKIFAVLPPVLSKVIMHLTNEIFRLVFLENKKKAKKILQILKIMKESIVSNSLYKFTFSFTFIKLLHCLLSEMRAADELNIDCFGFLVSTQQVPKAKSFLPHRRRRSTVIRRLECHRQHLAELMSLRNVPTAGALSRATTPSNDTSKISTNNLIHCTCVSSAIDVTARKTH